MIGASKVGDENAFLVYHCTRNSNGRRKLVKVGHFKCEDPDTTMELIGQIRQGASSREELQPYGKTILAVINPMAGKGRYVPNLFLLRRLYVSPPEEFSTAHMLLKHCVSSHAGVKIGSCICRPCYTPQESHVMVLSARMQAMW